MPAARLRSLLPLLVCCALIGAVYAPFLLEGHVQIHGDGVAFSVPMLHLLKASLARGELPLWTELAYGGHPVFAEGQIGALNPLNVLVAALFQPIVGHTVYHLLALLLSAAGAFALARRLGASAAAAGVCAVSLALSPLWLGTQNNLTISAASMCVPWLLWAFERWLARLRHADAALFGLVCALMVFSGYPQIVHGCAIYLAVRGIAALADPADRARLLARPGHTALGLGLMLLLSALIAAAQLLPLAELAGLSYRKAGVDFLEAPGSWYLRGMLFSLYQPGDESTPLSQRHFNLVGSITVCALAAASLLFARRRGVLPHLAASFLLFNLGLSNSSPLWRLLHEHELLPGLRLFRIMSPYFNVGMVGFALLAGLAVDGLAREARSARRLWPALPVGIALAGLVYVAIDAQVSAWHFAGPAVLLAALALRTRWSTLPLAPLLLAVLAVEVIALRLQPFALHPKQLLTEPASASLFAGEERRLYRHFDGSTLVLYAQQNPLGGRVAPGLLRSLEGLTPTANVLWGVASMHGGMALDLARRKLIEEPLRAEIADPALRREGTRLIDTLAVKFITGGLIAESRGMPLAYRSPDGAVAIFENTRALPKFRTHVQTRAVASPEAALAALAHTPPDTLLVECTDAHCVRRTQEGGVGDIRLQLREMMPARMRFDIEATAAGWLFVADADYPGWIARLDGEEVPLYPAQLLGKAVAFGPGSHRLTLRFRPRSVQIGQWLTAAGLLLALGTIGAGRAGDARIRAPR